MTISTAGLTSSIRSAITAMRAAHPRSRERIITADEACDIAAAVRKTLRAVTADDTRVSIVSRGGYVANAYKYSAESDTVLVTVDIKSGLVAVHAARERAQTRRGCAGELLIARIAREGQHIGRTVSL